jgi:hypothetical protein
LADARGPSPPSGQQLVTFKSDDRVVQGNVLVQFVFRILTEGYRDSGHWKRAARELDQGMQVLADPFSSANSSTSRGTNDDRVATSW